MSKIAINNGDIDNQLFRKADMIAIVEHFVSNMHDYKLKRKVSQKAGVITLEWPIDTEKCYNDFIKTRK